MYETLNLLELTTSQLETALEIGEGLTNVSINEIVDSSLLDAKFVALTDGKIVRLPTLVKYRVMVKDEYEEDGELKLVIFVHVTELGIIANF